MRRAHGAAVLVALAVTTAVLAGVGGAAAAQSDVTLTVTVVDESGESISGVDLSASWDGGSTNETTRSNGQALVDVPAGADVTIRATHPEYVLRDPVVVEDADGGAVEIEMAPTGTATVTVESADGDPVGNAVVRLFRDGSLVVNERTDDGGTLVTERVETGEYRLVAFGRGYLRTETTVDVDGDVSTTVDVEEGSALATVSVVDDHFDPARPLRDATVRIEGVGSVQTLGGGEATLGVPVNSRLDVAVSRPGYENVTRTVRVNESPVNFTVATNRTDELTLESDAREIDAGGQVSLTVTDEYGDPVSGATVSLDGEAVGETDADGRATLSIDSGGEHTIAVTSGEVAAETTVEVIATPTATATPTQTATPTRTATPTPTAEPALNTTVTLDTGGTNTTTSDTGPGFGAAGATLALALATLALAAGRRRH